jgi:hypothetical protein
LLVPALNVTIGVAVGLVVPAAFMPFFDLDSHVSLPSIHHPDESAVTRVVNVAPGRTRLTPVLDAPLARDENLAWCPTLTAAWRDLMAIENGPIRMEREAPVVTRLNREAARLGDLDTRTLFSFAGFAGDGVIQRNRELFAARFPERPLPGLLAEPPALADDDLVAFGYLDASLPFRWRFERNPQEHHFAGQPVESFGFYQYIPFVRAKALAASQLGVHDFRGVNDFIIELKVRFGDESDPESRALPEFPAEWDAAAKVADEAWRRNFAKPADAGGHRLFLAKVPPRRTLAETVEAVRGRIARSRPKQLEVGRSLTIPILDFKLDHTFQELTGRPLRARNFRLNGQPIEAAYQTIRFRLDETGAEVRSEAGVLASIEEDIVFDRPFLVLIEAGSDRRPCFALWVGNADLMIPRP